MPGPFSGGCACGAIRYECSAEPPYLSANCHCRDCQRASGSAFVALLIVPLATFALAKGAPQYYRVTINSDYTANSDYTVDRGFCPACGSPMFLKVQRMMNLGFLYIVATSLDDPSWFRPAIDAWTSSAQPWDYMNPALPKFAGGLTDEQVKERLASL